MSDNFAVKAREAANSAQLLLNVGDLDGAWDRAYWAMMHFDSSGNVKIDKFADAMDRFIVLRKAVGHANAPVRDDVEWAVAAVRSLILEV